MADITKDEMRERLGNIDQIRDIIFGSQLREYSSRFEQIESDLGIIQQELHDRVEQLKTMFVNELKAAVDTIDKKLKLLSVNQQEEMTDQRQQLDRLNRKLANSIHSLDESIDGQTSALRNELTQTRTQLQDDIHNLRSLVVEELERRFATLRSGKLSKDDLAEILFELGMRLKGGDVVPKLKEVADSRELLLPED